MAQIGNAENSKINGERGKHVRKKMKKYTSKLRRISNKGIIKDRLNHL